MIDTATIKQQQSMIGLAERHTALHKVTAREWAGPCPNPSCSARSDGFHVHEDGWFKCYTCHPKRGDAIELVQWLGLAHDFRSACELLAGGALPELPGSALPAAVAHKPVYKPKPKENFDQSKWAAVVAAASDKLFSSEGEPGQQFLLSRGLEAHTWLQFGLGFVPLASLPGTKGKLKAPAISLPWYFEGELLGVRLRFLQEHIYKNFEGTEIEANKAAAYGSDFTGFLFGEQALAGAGHCLIVCEGELNSLALWQVARETAADVLSMGSEKKGGLPESVVQLAGQYEQVFVWLDKPELARAAAIELPGASAINSPPGPTKELDANDLLKQGKLGGFLTYARIKVCKGAEEQQRLHSVLWDAASRVQGLDSGTAQGLEYLAAELGRPVGMYEAEPGRWLAKVKIGDK